MENGYYKTKASVQEYIKLSKGVNGQFLIDKLKLFLQKKSLLLEIGSGPGSDWEILSKSFNVIGSDNSQEFIKHLKEKFSQGEFLELDASILNISERIDGIYSNKVMHHLKDSELKKSIKRQSEILNPGGVVCHSFWKGEGSEIFKGLFVNYHTQETVIRYFEKYFDILILECYQEFDKDDSLFLIAKKKN